MNLQDERYRMREENVNTMIEWTAYGSPDVLQRATTQIPIPKPGELLIRIGASSVTAGDCEMRELNLPLGLSLPFRLYAGWKRPRRIRSLGQEFCGFVEALGEGVSRFSPGERVYGTTGFGFGAYGHYICLPAEPKEAMGVIGRAPSKLKTAELATLPVAGMEALGYLGLSPLAASSRVLIIGAGGSIGTLFLQLAKYHHAEVTVVDRKEKLSRLVTLGADHCIADTDLDPGAYRHSFDVILDVVGKRGVLQRMRALKPQGTYHLAYAWPRHLLYGLLARLLYRKRLSIRSSNQRIEDLEGLSTALKKGILEPVVDSVFPLERIIEAHSYAQQGIKVGSIAISMD